MNEGSHQILGFCVFLSLLFNGSVLCGVSVSLLQMLQNLAREGASKGVAKQSETAKVQPQCTLCTLAGASPGSLLQRPLSVARAQTVLSLSLPCSQLTLVPPTPPSLDSVLPGLGCLSGMNNIKMLSYAVLLQGKAGSGVGLWVPLL